MNTSHDDDRKNEIKMCEVIRILKSLDEHDILEKCGLVDVETIEMSEINQKSIQNKENKNV